MTNSTQVKESLIELSYMAGYCSGASCVWVDAMRGLVNILDKLKTIREHMETPKTLEEVEAWGDLGTELKSLQVDISITKESAAEHLQELEAKCHHEEMLEDMHRAILVKQRQNGEEMRTVA